MKEKTQNQQDEYKIKFLTQALLRKLNQTPPNSKHQKSLKSACLAPGGCEGHQKQQNFENQLLNSLLLKEQHLDLGKLKETCGSEDESKSRLAFTLIFLCLKNEAEKHNRRNFNKIFGCFTKPHSRVIGLGLEDNKDFVNPKEIHTHLNDLYQKEKPEELLQNKTALFYYRRKAKAYSSSMSPKYFEREAPGKDVLRSESAPSGSLYMMTKARMMQILSEKRFDKLPDPRVFLFFSCYKPVESVRRILSKKKRKRKKDVLLNLSLRMQSQPKQKAKERIFSTNDEAGGSQVRRQYKNSRRGPSAGSQLYKFLLSANPEGRRKQQNPNPFPPGLDQSEDYRQSANKKNGLIEANDKVGRRKRNPFFLIGRGSAKKIKNSKNQSGVQKKLSSFISQKNSPNVQKTTKNNHTRQDVSQVTPSGVNWESSNMSFNKIQKKQQKDVRIDERASTVLRYRIRSSYTKREASYPNRVNIDISVQRDDLEKATNRPRSKSTSYGGLKANEGPKNSFTIKSKFARYQKKAKNWQKPPRSKTLRRESYQSLSPQSSLSSSNNHHEDFSSHHKSRRKRLKNDRLKSSIPPKSRPIVKNSLNFDINRRESNTKSSRKFPIKRTRRTPSLPNKPNSRSSAAQRSFSITCQEEKTPPKKVEFSSTKKIPKKKNQFKNQPKTVKIARKKFIGKSGYFSGTKNFSKNSSRDDSTKSNLINSSNEDRKCSTLKLISATHQNLLPRAIHKNLFEQSVGIDPQMDFVQNRSSKALSDRDILLRAFKADRARNDSKLKKYEFEDKLQEEERSRQDKYSKRRELYVRLSLERRRKMKKGDFER